VRQLVIKVLNIIDTWYNHEIYSTTLSLTLALDGYEWSASRPGRSTAVNKPVLTVQ
jgi:hypothetical protein